MLITKIIKKNNFLSLVFFHLIFVVICFTNFEVGKFFLGWDSLNPEFNFPLNFSRAIFAAWQENYGLGLLGGHGFAATLPHTIITYIFSLVLPQEAIRFAFTFLCLYLGGLGVYFLTNLLLKKFLTEDKLYAPYIALISALFYILNLGSVQVFYVQLETFIGHFAALPWLFWIIIKLLEKISTKNILLFLVINFFATLQGFIPALFIAYVMALIIFLIVYYITNKNFAKSLLKKYLLIAFLTFTANSYWFFPFGYYQIANGEIFLDSYNNLISTPHFIEVNNKYGDLVNVPLLKGYLFDSHELGNYLLTPWISHQNLFVLIFGYIFFLIILIGLLHSLIFSKNKYLKAFAFVFLFFFISLATNIFPFSLYTSFLQEISPTYEQAFRTAFTKFSVGLSFSYSIFFGVGILVLFKILHIYLKKVSFIYLLYILVLISLFCYSFPIFKGDLIYDKLKIEIPSAYLEVMDYFKTQPDGRIADFPQDCPAGWYAYKWGYLGSGFYWYGVKQPFLSRSFDVWSNLNENYYWEINAALKAQDYQRVDKILQKYSVKWIVYDPNLLNCRNQKGVFLDDELFNYLINSSNYEIAREFKNNNIAPITIFLNKNIHENSFINIKSDLPNIAPKTNLNDLDVAYLKYGDYINSQGVSLDSYLPFSSLFTKRGTNENAFGIEDRIDYFVFKARLPENLAGSYLTHTNYSNLEKYIPVEISLDNITADRYEIKANYLFPQIFIDKSQITNSNNPLKIGEISESNLNNLKVFLNGEEIKAEGLSSSKFKSIFLTNTNNKLQIIDNNQKVVFQWTSNNSLEFNTLTKNSGKFYIPEYKDGILEVFLYKANNSKITTNHQIENFENLTPESCYEAMPTNRNKFEIGGEQSKFIRLISNNSKQCLNLNFPDFVTSNSYLFEIRSRNISGNKLKFLVLNKDRVVFNEVFLLSNKSSSQFNSSYLIIPPSFSSELGYTAQLENDSESFKDTVNDFAGMSAWWIPFNLLKNIEIQKSEVKSASSALININVNHPNVSYYNIKINDQLSFDSSNILILNQGFDNGWKAYKLEEGNSFLNKNLPFLVGENINQQILVNNWANGFLLNDTQANQQIVIVYLPQYLGFLGYCLLIISLIWIFIRNFTKK